MANKYVKIATTFQAGESSSLADARANWSEDVTEATTGSKAPLRNAGDATIADSGSLSVGFGSVTTAHYVFVKSSRQVTLKFNGDSNGILLGHTAASGGFVALATAVTSLAITNASGDSADVVFELYGV